MEQKKVFEYVKDKKCPAKGCENMILSCSEYCIEHRFVKKKHFRCEYKIGNEFCKSMMLEKTFLKNYGVCSLHKKRGLAKRERRKNGEEKWDFEFEE